VGAKTRKTPPELVYYIIDQLKEYDNITHRRFFGGWALLIHGEQFAIVMKQTLYFRVNEKLGQELIAGGGMPFSYKARNKQVSVRKYISAPDSCLDDGHELRDWFAKAIGIVSLKTQLNWPKSGELSFLRE